MTAYVYQIVHVSTGREYVGVTSQAPEQRWAEHRSRAKARYNRHLYNSLRKHGADAFAFKVIATLPTFDEAKIAERIAIAIRKPVYNLTVGGEGTVGFKFSPEQLARLSVAHVGLKQTDESRAKRSESLKRAYAEGRRKVADGARLALTAWNRAGAGKRLSAEHCAKLSAAGRGRKRPPEAIAKTAAGLRGRQVSAETRAKISAAASSISDATRAKMSDSAKRRWAKGCA